MTINSFYDAIKTALKEETDAGKHYSDLAKEAPNEEFRKELYKMARQEIMHHARLEGMLLEWNE